MSYSLVRGKWEVRWRDGDGRQRSRRFDDEVPAQAFDEAIHDQRVKERKQTGYGESGGVYLASLTQRSMSSGWKRSGPSSPPILIDGMRPCLAAS